MLEGLTLQSGLLLAGGFFLLSVIASRASTKLGIPALVLFMAIGMLAGSDGPGGIPFENYQFSKTLGSLALAFILFAGGLESNFNDVKPVFWRGLSLATFGVILTASLVFLFAHYVIGVPLVESLLLGSVVSSTDAAAVFGVLRSRRIGLKHNLAPLLEFESGSNDAVAVLLTTMFTQMAIQTHFNFIDYLPQLVLQLPLGFLVGVFFGYLAYWLMNHIRLDNDGLYSVISISTVCLSFGVSHLIHGNEFLATYVAGITLGSKNFVHKISITQFHDGLAWLMQISVFVILGLLAFPSRVLELWIPGISLALFLMLIARPVAVFVSLLFVRLQKRSKFFVSWAGLRGAVPVILATFPLTAGVGGAQQLFDLVFFVVLLSVIIQGTTLGRLAKVVGVQLKQSDNLDLTPVKGSELIEVVIGADSPVIGKQVVELGMPSTALLVLLKRQEQSYIPRGSTVLELGDLLVVATRKEDQEELRLKLAGKQNNRSN